MQKFLLTNTVLVLSNFVYLFRYHWTLAGIYVMSILAVLGMARLYFNTCNYNIKRLEGLYDDCHEEIEDTLQNLLSIYTSKKIPDEKSRIEDINNVTRSEQYNAGICNRKYRIYFSITNIFLFLVILFNIIFFILLIENNVLDDLISNTFIDSFKKSFLYSHLLRQIIFILYFFLFKFLHSL